MHRRRLFIAVFALLGVVAFGIDYPRIEELGPRDPLFRQQQEDLRLFHLRSRTGEAPPSLVLYTFDASQHESILTVAARVNIPYSSIATLNGIVGTDIEVEDLLIPNIPGIFIPSDPRNLIDRVLFDNRVEQLAEESRIRVATPAGRHDFYFLVGEDFRPDERRAFLGAMFAMPVRATRVSSRFGYRRHPITDVVQFHNGVDLAAPYGAPVRASADGVIAEIGFDPLLGSFVVVRHSGGYETRYAHLSRVDVKLNEAVGSGTIIGRVGTTGLTTGPHLHFELREAGTPKDPLLLLPRTELR